MNPHSLFGAVTFLGIKGRECFADKQWRCDMLSQRHCLSASFKHGGDNIKENKNGDREEGVRAEKVPVGLAEGEDRVRPGFYAEGGRHFGVQC